MCGRGSVAGRCRRRGDRVLDAPSLQRMVPAGAMPDPGRREYAPNPA